MSRPRKPSFLHELNGSFDHDPQRRRARESEPVDSRPLGDPPLHLGPDARVAWFEIERISAPGVLCHGDRLVVELAAVLLGCFRVMGASMPDPKISRLESILGRLGLSPSDRSRVVARNAQQTANRFSNNGKRENSI